MTVPRRILLAGGRNRPAPSSSIGELVPAPARRESRRVRSRPSERLRGRRGRTRSARPSARTARSSTCRTARATPSTRSTRAPSRSSGTSPSARCPQHVTPSYDLKTLYVLNDLGNSLTPIDPRTGAPGTHDPGRRPVQHVLHARRSLRDRRRRAAAPPRLPRPAHLPPPPFAARPLPRRRPHGLLRRRPLPASRPASSRAS